MRFHFSIKCLIDINLTNVYHPPLDVSLPHNYPILCVFCIQLCPASRFISSVQLPIVLTCPLGPDSTARFAIGCLLVLLHVLPNSISTCKLFVFTFDLRLTSVLGIWSCRLILVKCLYLAVELV